MRAMRSVFDCDIRIESGPAGTIDHAAVANDDVVFRGGAVH